MTCKRQPYVYQALSLPNVFFFFKNLLFLNLKKTALHKNYLSIFFEEFSLNSDILKPADFYFSKRNQRIISSLCATVI